MSWMICQKCGQGFGMIGTQMFVCACPVTNANPPPPDTPNSPQAGAQLGYCERHRWQHEKNSVQHISECRNWQPRIEAPPAPMREQGQSPWPKGHQEWTNDDSKSNSGWICECGWRGQDMFEHQRGVRAAAPAKEEQAMMQDEQPVCAGHRIYFTKKGEDCAICRAAQPVAVREDAEALRELDLALQAGQTRYTHTGHEEDWNKPGVAYEVAFTMPQWSVVLKALSALLSSSVSGTGEAQEGK